MKTGLLDLLFLGGRWRPHSGSRRALCHSRPRRSTARWCEHGLASRPDRRSAPYPDL